MLLAAPDVSIALAADAMLPKTFCEVGEVAGASPDLLMLNPVRMEAGFGDVLGSRPFFASSCSIRLLSWRLAKAASPVNFVWGADSGIFETFGETGGVEGVDFGAGGRRAWSWNESDGSRAVAEGAGSNCEDSMLV